MSNVKGRQKTLNNVRRILQKPSDKRTAEDLRKLNEGLLKDVNFFKDVETDVCLACCRLLKYKSYGANEIIFEEGDEGVLFYIVIDGQVAVWLRDVTVEEVAAEAEKLAEESRMLKKEEEAQRLKLEQEKGTLEKDDAERRLDLLRKQATTSSHLANKKNMQNKSAPIPENQVASPSNEQGVESLSSAEGPSSETSLRPSEHATASMPLDIFVNEEDPEVEEENDFDLGDGAEEEDEEEVDSLDSMDSEEYNEYEEQISRSQYGFQKVNSPTGTGPPSPNIRVTETASEAQEHSRESQAGPLPQGSIRPSVQNSSTNAEDARFSTMTAGLVRPSRTSLLNSPIPFGKRSHGSRESIGGGSLNLNRRFSCRNKQVATLSDGQSFGEIALQTSEPRTATVRTILPTQLATLDRESYKACLSRCLEEQQQERLDFIEQIRFFDDLSEDTKAKMSFLMQIRRFAKGEVVFPQDSPVTEVYFVKDGEFAIQRNAKRPKNFLQKKATDNFVTVGLHVSPQPFGFQEYLQGERRHKDRVVCNSLEGTLYCLLCTKLISQLSVEARRNLLMFSKGSDKFHSNRELALNALAQKKHWTGMKALVPESNIPRVLRRERALWVQRMPRRIVAEVVASGNEAESADPRERDIYSPEGRIRAINRTFCNYKKDDDFDAILDEHSMWYKAFSAKTIRSIHHSRWLKNNPKVMDDSEVTIRSCWASEEPDSAWVAPEPTKEEANAVTTKKEDALIKDEAYQRLLGWKLLHGDGPKPWSLNRRDPVIPSKRVHKNRREMISESQELRQERVLSSVHEGIVEESSAMDDCPQSSGLVSTEIRSPLNSLERKEPNSKVESQRPCASGNPNEGSKILAQSPGTASTAARTSPSTPQKIFDPRTDGQPTLRLLCKQGLRLPETPLPPEQSPKKWKALPNKDAEEEQYRKREKPRITEIQSQGFCFVDKKADAKSKDPKWWKWQHFMQSQAVHQAYLCIMPPEDPPPEKSVEESEESEWYWK